MGGVGSASAREYNNKGGGDGDRRDEGRRVLGLRYTGSATRALHATDVGGDNVPGEVAASSVALRERCRSQSCRVAVT